MVNSKTCDNGYTSNKKKLVCKSVAPPAGQLQAEVWAASVGSPEARWRRCVCWWLPAGWCSPKLSLVSPHLFYTWCVSVALQESYKRNGIRRVQRNILVRKLTCWVIWCQIAVKIVQTWKQTSDLRALRHPDLWETFLVPMGWHRSVLTDEDELEEEFWGLAGRRSDRFSSHTDAANRK